jgi:hypothetical protein
MKLGSLQGVVGDLEADLTRIVRAYRAHPETWRIVAYLALGAIAAIFVLAIVVIFVLPNVSFPSTSATALSHP